VLAGRDLFNCNESVITDVGREPWRRVKSAPTWGSSHIGSVPFAEGDIRRDPNLTEMKLSEKR